MRPFHLAPHHRRGLWEPQPPLLFSSWRPRAFRNFLRACMRFCSVLVAVTVLPVFAWRSNFAALPPRVGLPKCYNTCCEASSCGTKALRSGTCPNGGTRVAQTCQDPCCVDKAGGCCRLGPAPGPRPNGTGVAIPTPIQLEYQDREVGALNSFQMVTVWGGQLRAQRPFMTYSNWRNWPICRRSCRLACCLTSLAAPCRGLHTPCRLSA